jgi:hypothetical protein
VSNGNTGPLGQPRGVGFVILLTIVTLGIYSLYWVYKTSEEMKQHTGEGIGGVLGLVVWIVVGAVMAFVIPSEIGNMYKKDRLDWTVAVPVRNLHHPGDRLVREGAGRAQPVLGEQGSRRIRDDCDGRSLSR